MVHFYKVIVVLTLLLVTMNITAQEPDSSIASPDEDQENSTSIEALANAYDLEGLNRELLLTEKKLKENNTADLLYRAGAVSYYIGHIYDVKRLDAEKEKVFKTAIVFLKKSAELDPERFDTYYMLMMVYNDLIVDAASWGKYNTPLQENRKKAANLDADSPRMRFFQADQMLIMPESMGGDIDKALEEHIYLSENHPELYEIRYQLAMAYLRHGKDAEALEVMQNILADNPRMLPAYRYLLQLKVEEKQPVITKITILNKTKTNFAAVKSFIVDEEGHFDGVENLLRVGQTYSAERIAGINKRLSFFPRIGGISVDFNYDEENNTVELGVIVNETTMRVFGLAGGMNFSFNHKAPYFNAGGGDLGGIGTIVYMDDNFLNFNIELTLICAFVYWNVNFTRRNLIGGVLDTKIGGEVFVFPMGGAAYYDADRSSFPKYSYSSNNIKGYVSVGKDFDFGLSTFVTYEVNKDFYFKNSNSHDDMVLPDNMDEEPVLSDKTPMIRHTWKFDLNYASISYMDTGRYIPKGFEFGLGTSLQTYQNHRDWWGVDGEFVQWKPQVPLTVHWYAYAGGYFHFADIMNIKLYGHYVGGINYYNVLNKPTIGSGMQGMPNNFQLHGFKGGEFMGDHIIMGNFTIGVEPVKNRLHIQFLYDIGFIDPARMAWPHYFKPLHAVGLDFHIQLPHEIMLDIEYGYGMNDLRGDFTNGQHKVSFTIKRIWLF